VRSFAASLFDLPVRPILVGHRGGRGATWPPENTLAALERARERGAHAVEIDARLCASGEVVVAHDPTLRRMTSGADSRAVARLTLSELGLVSLQGTPHRIPTLRAVLAWADAGGVGVNVEIKHDVPRRRPLVRAVAAELAAFPRLPRVVSSFDPLILTLLAAYAPEVPRALLTESRQRYAPLLHALSRPSLLHALHVERTEATPPRVAAWKARGLRVGVWTVNDPDEAGSLARAGADLLISDDVAELR
jgi:glycerophosphoryl diester phosphodiesterase